MVKVYAQLASDFPQFKDYLNHNSEKGCISEMWRAEKNGSIVYKFVKKASSQHGKNLAINTLLKNLLESALSFLDEKKKLNKLGKEISHSLSKHHKEFSEQIKKFEKKQTESAKVEKRDDDSKVEKDRKAEKRDSDKEKFKDSEPITDVTEPADYVGDDKDSKKIERSYPPLSFCDTVKGKWVDGKLILSSVHGQGESFQDSEIILPVLTLAANPPKIAKGANGKTVIQQQATRGCTAACAAMLLADNGIEVDLKLLRGCNLGNEDSMTLIIEQAGFQVLKSKIQSLEELLEKIKANGAAIVSVNSGIGGHVIMVDSLSDDLSSAIIRDPYHGWQIKITGDALKRASAGTTYIIQIQN